jgi:RHS repeat-associated protein
MTDNSGVIQDQRTYDPFGRTSRLQGSLTADYQYGGYYVHTPSGLNLAVYRSYGPTVGRWLSRDLLEFMGPNDFAYVSNEPIGANDWLGLFQPFVPGTNFCGQGRSSGHGPSSDPNQHWGEEDPLMPMPGDPLWKNPVRGPLHALDVCCMRHDLCMHKAHFILDDPARQHARECCDRNMFGCAEKAGLTHPWLAPVLVPFGIGFGVKSVLRGPGSYVGPALPFGPGSFGGD